MASYSIEEFVGDGALKPLIPRLADDGWDDIPTLKMMKPEDMDQLKLTEPQKDALELRSYLHNRFLMEFADRMEASKKPLAELLTLSSSDLSSLYGMKSCHVFQFVDRTLGCKITAPSSACDAPFAPRGIIAADEPVEPQLGCCCGALPPPVVDIAPYSSVEAISVQKLAPEYKIGTRCFATSLSPPLKASSLWRDKAAVLLCIRRPGCIMCRAEAHRIYAHKRIFDAMGFRLIAVLHEYIESELKEFWPRFWGGAVIFDPRKDFFRALGGGALLRESFVSGFVLNPRAISNYMRARSTGIPNNLVGEGDVKGGILVVGSGERGVAYQYVERNFGDWPPVEEVVEACIQLNDLAVKQSEMKMQRG